MDRILALLCCATVIFIGTACLAQTESVTVVASSLVVTPYDINFSNPGHSHTSCNGNSSVFGNFGNMSMNCDTTTEQPSVTTQTHHIYMYYSVVQGEHNLYLLSCTRKWRWERCQSLIPGEKYIFSTQSNKVVLQASAGGKQIKLALVEAAALLKPAAASLEQQTPVRGQSATTQSRQANTRVDVTSSPAGAEIMVDGDFVGNTPSELFLQSGTHEISIAKSGGKPWNRTVKTSGGNISIHADLEPVK